MLSEKSQTACLGYFSDWHETQKPPCVEESLLGAPLLGSG